MKNFVMLVTAIAVLAPAGAFAMPMAGVSAQASFEGAKVERSAVVIKTGPRVIRRAPVVVRRPIVRRPAARVIIR